MVLPLPRFKRPQLLQKKKPQGKKQGLPPVLARAGLLGQLAQRVPYVDLIDDRIVEVETHV